MSGTTYIIHTHQATYIHIRQINIHTHAYMHVWIRGREEPPEMNTYMCMHVCVCVCVCADCIYAYIRMHSNLHTYKEPIPWSRAYATHICMNIHVSTHGTHRSLRTHIQRYSIYTYHVQLRAKFACIDTCVTHSQSHSPHIQMTQQHSLLKLRESTHPNVATNLCLY